MWAALLVLQHWQLAQASPQQLQWDVVSSLVQVFPTTAWVPATGSAALLEGARAEHLAFQIVLRPSVALNSVSVSAASPLAGGGGSSIDGAAIVRRVVCVNVSAPAAITPAVSAESCPRVWPDPLPLLSTADVFHPNSTGALWVTLTVPADAARGLYRGSLELRGSLGAEPVALLASIPLELTVLNFSVSQRSLRTDSKLSDTWVHRYASREPDGGNLTAVMLRYLREMVDHRVNMMGWGCSIRLIVDQFSSVFRLMVVYSGTAVSPSSQRSRPTFPRTSAPFRFTQRRSTAWLPH